jgi:hypothetical protein
VQQRVAEFGGLFCLLQGINWNGIRFLDSGVVWQGISAGVCSLGVDHGKG